MSKVTFYVEYEEGKESTIGANTEVLGGKLLGFYWGDGREQVKDDLRLLIMSSMGISSITDENVGFDCGLARDICDAFDLLEDEE